MAIRRVAIIFDNAARPETTGTYCRRALHEFVEAEHILPSECHVAKVQAFDLYLNIDDGLSYEWPKDLHPSAFWAIDTHIDFDACLSKAREFDFVFAAQRDGANRLRDAGIPNASWLPLACDPKIHFKHDVEKVYDTCFIGNMVGDERSSLVTLIQNRFRKNFVGRLYFEEMAKTYSASRIIFNRSVRNDVNMRVFEALACGSMLVTNDLTENGQAELFVDGTHLATYSDADELVDKIAYYLAHRDTRERIAAAGRQLVLDKHTYAHRMERLLGEIQGQLQRTRVPVHSTATPLTSKDRTYFEFHRPELVSLVPLRAGRILDIGCGAGRVGESLKARQDAHVTGIELDGTAATLARSRLDRVIEGNVEQINLEFGHGEFDAVLCGDVLEHLRDPLTLLRNARGWLTSEGCLVASIPNVRHHSVIRGLIDGNWTYESAGLLDEDHVRFFTRREIEKLFFHAGFQHISVHTVPGPGHAEWVNQNRPGSVRAGRLHIGGLTVAEAEEFYAYQYLVVASQGHSGVAPDESRDVSSAKSSERATRADRLKAFAGEHPWPPRKPAVKLPVDNDGWLEDGARQILGEAVSHSTRLVVELGTWLGKSTRFIADQATNAVVIAIDHWQGSPEHYKRAEWRSMLPTLYETFLAMSWDYRDRIIPLKMKTGDGLRLVAASDLKPDVIYIDSEHSFGAVTADLTLALELFPQATIVGDDLDEPGVAAAVNQIARSHCLSVQAAGTNWKAWRLRKPHHKEVFFPNGADCGLTSIVIVTHNQLEYTKQCIDSIRRLTDEPYELIVVDNNSTDGTIDFLSTLSNVALIRNDQNRGFPAAVNQGIRAVRGDQILLLNNDTIVTTGWLRRMLQVIKSDPAIGLVGPCSNMVSGEQQVAVTYESIDSLDGFAWDWGQDNNGHVIDTDRLVGFCLLIRRDVVDRIGLLDEQFGVGCFEDDDYTLRARNAGFRAVIARDAFVHHFGGRTFAAVDVDFAALMDENRKKLQEKWSLNAAARPTPDRARTVVDSKVSYELHRAPNRGLLLTRHPVQLSLCMIVRNNARTIRAALESVRPWVDEMIVVDTGSTDDTAAIAEALGARVYHFAWCDDFSAARNESLKYARGRWIFWMDSDDVIDAERGRQLRTLALGSHADSVFGYVARVHCPGDEGNGEFDMTVVDHVKLFRNLPQLRFDGRIHEQIVPAIRAAGGDIAWSDLFVVHAGYDRSSDGQKHKIERDLRLLHKELDERPKHPFTLFNLGMTYANIGKFEEAVDYLQRSIAHASVGESQVRKAYALLGGAFDQLDKHDQALETYANGLKLFPLDLELRFRRAGTLHQVGRLAEAAEAYAQLLSSREERHFTSIDVGISGFKARQNLAAVYKDMGDHIRAEHQWRIIVEEVPKYISGWIGLADSLTQQGRHREAMRVHEEIVRLEPDSASAHHNLGTTLLILEDWAAAASAFRESIRLRPDAAVTQMHLGYAWKNLGARGDAVAAFGEVLRLVPETPMAIEAGEHIKQLAE